MAPIFFLDTWRPGIVPFAQIEELRSVRDDSVHGWIMDSCWTKEPCHVQDGPRSFIARLGSSAGHANKQRKYADAGHTADTPLCTLTVQALTRVSMALKRYNFASLLVERTQRVRVYFFYQPLSCLVLSYTRHWLGGRSPLGRAAALLAGCPPPPTSNLQCGADRHQSPPFALSGSSVGQRGIFGL
jgi:hypothetical protein